MRGDRGEGVLKTRYVITSDTRVILFSILFTLGVVVMAGLLKEPLVPWWVEFLTSLVLGGCLCFAFVKIVVIDEIKE